MFNSNTISKWNRKILNVYWIILLFSILIEMINSFLTVDDYLFFIYHSVIVPTFLSAVGLVIGELIIRNFTRLQDYIIISIGTLLSGIQIHSHYGMPVLYSALFLSTMVAISYYNRRKIYYSSALNIICFVILYQINTYIHESTSLVELMTFITFMMIAASISIAIMVQGITLLKERDELESEANHDSLTNLFNRRYFDNQYERLMVSRQDGHIALLDIDNFKAINDTYGHLVGDIVIQKIARILKESVGLQDECFRYGGEEFAIIFENQSESVVIEKLNHILLVIASLNLHELEGNRITISIGVSAMQPDGSTIAQADASLYEAKRSGKNTLRYKTKIS